jgi:tetratricopeptide (TPR) repeat protein
LIQRDPGRAALRDDIAVLYMELNRPAQAIPHFQAALNLKPGSAPAHFNYGTALAAAGRVEDAITQYERALVLRPGYAIAHNNLGTALVQLGRPQLALASFRRAATIDPELGDAHLNVGLVSRALGDFPESITHFRKALDVNGDWVTAISALASVLAAAPDASVRQPAEAVRLADKAVALTHRRDATALDVLAVAHAAAGDFGRATDVADEALRLNPPAPVANMIRAHRALFARREAYVSPR